MKEEFKLSPPDTSTSLPPHWLGRPYYALDAYLKHKFGEKVYKISIDAGFTCPNRDGTLDTRGCIFCSAGGSGDFAVKINTSTLCKDTLLSMEEQISRGLAVFGSKKTGSRFIAYFQAYTNTYGPVEYLEAIYTRALSHPKIAGISIATRPDCLPHEVLALLASLKERYPEKELWVELGLQTIHRHTADYIRRGYPLSCFDDACLRLQAIRIPVIVHIILGLPGETRQDMLDTIAYINRCRPGGIKLQLLHVLKGTDLAAEYTAGKFSTLSKEAYVSIVTDCLTRLRPDIVIHRLTGDGSQEMLLAPLWSRKKIEVLNALHRHLRETGSFQGQYFDSRPESPDSE